MNLHSIRYRRNLTAEKLKGHLACLSWAEFLVLLGKPTETWPQDKFASPKATGDPEQVEFETPMGSFHAPLTEQTELGGTILEVLSGVYEWSSVKIKRNDIVLDLGANLGVFTRWAFLRGASRVISFEANPKHVPHLKRTFQQELEEGRLKIIESPVWADKGPVHFGGASLTGRVQETGTLMEAVTIDEIVKELRLPRVDFIKADIEGAERHALRGAVATLKEHRPRLAFCIYHYPDDPAVIQSLVRSANDYAVTFDTSKRYVYCQ